MPVLERLRSLSLTTKLIIAVILLIIVLNLMYRLIVPQSSPFGVGLPAAMTTFAGQHEHFSIDVPESWTILETPQGSHGDIEIIAGISVPWHTWPKGRIARSTFLDGNVDQVAMWGRRRAERRDGYELASIEPTGVGGLDGLLHEYSWESYSPILGTITIQCWDAYVLYDTSGYAVSLCAEQQEWSQTQEVFQQMIGSFSIW
jgi:hypothetical protein